MFPSITVLAFCALTLFSTSYAATKKFAIEVTWSTQSPDGFSRQQILVNGQSPGPALIIDVGDEVEFYVSNKLDIATAIHFHGITQLDSPWSDGVPGLSQKPIEAGGDWLYKWTADEYGTYWYHAHYQSQVSDGLFGPIYIRPSADEKRPFSAISSDQNAIDAMMKAEQDPQFVVISDWFHITSEEHWRLSQASNIDIYCTQSILFNGKGRVNCLSEADQRAALAPPFQPIFDGPLRGQWLSPNGCLPFGPFSQGGNASLNPSVLPADLITGCSATNTPQQDFQVDSRAQWASFNFISGTSIQAPVLSIDEHPMWVYAVDGRYIEPIQVNGLQIYNGERYSVMVQLDKRQGSYTMRANNFALNQLISGFASVTYTRGTDDGNNTPDNGDNNDNDHDGYGPGWNGDQWNGGQGNGGGWYGGKAAGWKGGQESNRNRKGQNYGKYDGHWKRDSQPYFTYGGFPINGAILLNTSMIHPFDNIPPAQEVDQTHVLRVSRFGAPYIWTLDGNESYPMMPNEYAQDAPLLYFPESTAAKDNNLVIRTKNDTWIDIIFEIVDANGPPHPFHKHSNKAYILGRGTGPWNWTSVAEAAAAMPQFFNLENPQYRDGFTTLPSAGAPTWLAMRYHVVNPGAFLLHCHIQAHLTGGMAIAFLDGVGDFPAIPAEYGAQGQGNGIGGSPGWYGGHDRSQGHW